MLKEKEAARDENLVSSRLSPSQQLTAAFVLLGAMTALTVCAVWTMSMDKMTIVKHKHVTHEEARPLYSAINRENEELNAAIKALEERYTY